MDKPYFVSSIHWLIDICVDMILIYTKITQECNSSVNGGEIVLFCPKLYQELVTILEKLHHQWEHDYVIE